MKAISDGASTTVSDRVFPVVSDLQTNDYWDMLVLQRCYRNVKLRLCLVLFTVAGVGILVCLLFGRLLRYMRSASTMVLLYSSVFQFSL